MAKKTNKYKREYQKQRRRIQRSIRRLEKRGYVTQDILPKIPKNVTEASIRRLQKIDIKEIYKKSVKLDYETGEITPGTLARSKERSESAKKAAETRRRKWENKFKTPIDRRGPIPGDYYKFPSQTDIIINNFRTDVIARFPESAGPILEDWLRQLQSQFNDDDIADMLQGAADAGLLIDYSVAYAKELLLAKISEFMDFLPGASYSMKEDLMEVIERDEDWSNYQ